MERPNTVSGLIAKRDELAMLRKALEADIRRLTCDIGHLDAAIALFDPKQVPRAIQRYATQSRAPHGSLTPFVMDQLRKATDPVTGKNLADAWIAQRQLGDEGATFAIVRKRIGAALSRMSQQGLIKGYRVGDVKAWEVARPIPR